MALSEYLGYSPKVIQRRWALVYQQRAKIQICGHLLQVYVTVFADGPTRVLRFSDDPTTVNVDTEQSILDLAARLKQAKPSVFLSTDTLLSLKSYVEFGSTDL